MGRLGIQKWNSSRVTMGENGENYVWQDREIHFDDNVQNLEPRRGEFVIDAIEAIEDTKGNNGERGSLMITNLRMIWFSSKSKKVNLSIGYNSITNIAIKIASSRLRGSTQALVIETTPSSGGYVLGFRVAP